MTLYEFTYEIMDLDSMPKERELYEILQHEAHIQGWAPGWKVKFLPDQTIMKSGSTTLHFQVDGEYDKTTCRCSELTMELARQRRMNGED